MLTHLLFLQGVLENTLLIRWDKAPSFDPMCEENLFEEHSRAPSVLCFRTLLSTSSRHDLVYEETSNLGNGWDYTVRIYANQKDVWGEGTASDPKSLDAEGTPSRWLFYVFYNGSFDVIGSYEGDAVQVFIESDDQTWARDGEDSCDAPDACPQPLWPVIDLVIMAVLGSPRAPLFRDIQSMSTAESPNCRSALRSDTRA